MINTICGDKHSKDAFEEMRTKTTDFLLPYITALSRDKGSQYILFLGMFNIVHNLT